jgi:hypothetical protein
MKTQHLENTGQLLWTMCAKYCDQRQVIVLFVLFCSFTGRKDGSVRHVGRI